VKNRFLLLSSLALCLAISRFVPRLNACSTFKFQKGGELIYAHNLDQPGMRVTGIIYINKRGVFKTGRTFSEIAVGERMSGFYGARVVPSDLSWISRYGSVTFSPWGRDFPDGGVNEAGLYIWESGLADTNYSMDSRLPELMPSNWIQYVLDNCGRLEEALAAARGFRLAGMNWHFFVADAQGRCAAVEYLDGEAVIHRGEDMPVPVLFNQTYEHDLEALGCYKGFGGTYEPELEDPRVPRIAKAAMLLRDYDPARHKPLDYAKSVLHHVGNKPYKWGILVDMVRKEIHFNSEVCQTWKHFSYGSVDFSSLGPAPTLNMDQPNGGDVLERFHPQRDQEVKDLIMELGLPEGFWQYFHTTRERFAERSAGAYHEAERPERQFFKGTWEGAALTAGQDGTRETLRISLQTNGSCVSGTVRFRGSDYPLQHMGMIDRHLKFTFRTQKGTVVMAAGALQGDLFHLDLRGTEGNVGGFVLHRQPEAAATRPGE
jgi:hypothetical protein